MLSEFQDEDKTLVRFWTIFQKSIQKSTHEVNSWVLWNVDIIVLINVLSAVVAIQSNIALLVFLGQLCIAYLYATKVARAILIAHRQFSYKKTPCKLQSVFVCILLSSNELTFREFWCFTSFLKTWLEHLVFEWISMYA